MSRRVRTLLQLLKQNQVITDTGIYEMYQERVSQRVIRKGGSRLPIVFKRKELRRISRCVQTNEKVMVIYASGDLPLTLITREEYCNRGEVRRKLEDPREQRLRLTHDRARRCVVCRWNTCVGMLCMYLLWVFFFLAVLSLCCCTQAFSSCSEWRLLF